MKKDHLKIGRRYAARIGGRKVVVTILGQGVCGWLVRNEQTGRRCTITDSRQLTLVE